MTTTATEIASGRRPWILHPNFLACESGHPLRQFQKEDDPRDARWRGDLRRMAGHAFLRCETCQPMTFWFAVFVNQPDAFVLNYAIDQRDYRYWSSEGESCTYSTPEMLYLLHDPDGCSYNPEWRAR